jgi:hypothetical protein
MQLLRQLQASILRLFLPFIMTSCTYTSSVSQTNVPPQRGHLVEASVKKYIVLGFNFDNDEVLELRHKLSEKCPNSAIRGIMTQDLRTLYFLGFFWARETHAVGYCTGHHTADSGEGRSALGDEDTAKNDLAPLEPEISL